MLCVSFEYLSVVSDAQGVKAEIAFRVNEKMSEVSNHYHRLAGFQCCGRQYSVAILSRFKPAFSPLGVLPLFIHNFKWLRLIQNLSQSLFTLLPLLYSTDALLFTATCSFAVHHPDDPRVLVFTHSGKRQTIGGTVC